MKVNKHQSPSRIDTKKDEEKHLSDGGYVGDEGDDYYDYYDEDEERDEKDVDKREKNS